MEQRCKRNSDLSLKPEQDTALILGGKKKRRKIPSRVNQQACFSIFFSAGGGGDSKVNKGSHQYPEPQNYVIL